ncbi:MAG: hypothetical protein M3680_06945 [Myxococcota bacterium]|nr:hypothetical protein [Myxococcota bacterium]
MAERAERGSGTWVDARGDRTVMALGIALLLGYVVQAALALEWSWLARLQANDAYKISSGCGLAGYLVVQWSVARRRLLDPVGAVARHRLYGAFAPLVLYLHASRFAYGYLLVLALIYLSMVCVGLVHRPVLALRVRWLFTWWVVLHVATSVVVVVLGGYHVVIALAYE